MIKLRLIFEIFLDGLALQLQNLFDVVNGTVFLGGVKLNAELLRQKRVHVNGYTPTDMRTFASRKIQHTD
jgi:hypothetical protein